MNLPAPALGLVIRYSYLWAEDAEKGIEEGDKDRPAAIVVSIDTDDGCGRRIFVLPITHSHPKNGDHALKIPPDVARAAGLDAAPSWVVLSEFNEFYWPGFDLKIIPNSNPPNIAYGFLPPGFFNTLRKRWISMGQKRASKNVLRS